MQKAQKSGIPVATLVEVYNRGMEADGDQEKAFNRVNSFIAGGRARKLDADIAPNYETIKKALKGTRND